MPRAEAGYAAPTARVPRTIFQHAHRDGFNLFPVRTGSGEVGEVFLLAPDNLNGLDALVLWLFGGWTGAFSINVTINIGTCNELFNVHTQTVNAIAVNMVINEYECVDLTTTFATVLANLAARDMIWLTVDDGATEQDLFVVGLELQET